MQLMSKAMGWADNVILAVGPLGKITAIVGAIRIGGLPWFRAIIGRARESRAVPVPATVWLAYRHVAFIPQPAFTSPSCSCTGNVEIIELLLAPGATAEKQCHAGRSPMWWSRRAPATFCKKDFNALAQNLHIISGYEAFNSPSLCI